MTDDITFCLADCDTDCFRKPRYIRDQTIPHSYANFSKFCMAYQPKDESQTNVTYRFVEWDNGERTCERDGDDYCKDEPQKGETVLDLINWWDSMKEDIHDEA